MKLKNIEFLKLLPGFMRMDPANAGISKGVDDAIKTIATYSDNMSIWAAIDKLSEEELDDLAWEMNIAWYEKQSSIKTKREVIKTGRRVQKKLGTKWAVEEIVNIYFGDGYMSEWFEYQGEPGHFRIHSSNPSVSEENLNKFLRILSKVKRASAILDKIYIDTTGEVQLNTGVAWHITEVMTVTMREEK